MCLLADVKCYCAAPALASPFPAAHRAERATADSDDVMNDSDDEVLSGWSSESDGLVGEEDMAGIEDLWLEHLQCVHTHGRHKYASISRSVLLPVSGSVGKLGIVHACHFDKVAFSCLLCLHEHLMRLIIDVAITVIGWVEDVYGALVVEAKSVFWILC